VDGIGGPVTATGEVLVGRRGDDVVGFDDRGRVLWSTRLPDDAELVRAAAHDDTAYIAVSASGSLRPRSA
jgi:outer membrane protein assembly factor BamB